ncbi:MAG: DUF1772 domain-containing protein [Pseudomonadota bacterium]
MDVLTVTLIVATLLCALTAGLVFAFSSIVMPGLTKLDDKGFIRAFQMIDGVIQAGQAAFGVVWVGSLVAIIVAAALAVLQLDGVMRAVTVTSAIWYIVGVQIPTFTVNIPLNNALQRLDVERMNADALHDARRAFEPRWVRWNLIRTINACAVSLALMVILVGL